MSGIEIVGLIAAIVGLIEGTAEAYNAIKDLKDLPRAFKEVSKRLPIVKDTLQTAKRQAEKTTPDVESAAKIEPLLTGCEAKAKDLLDIFKQIEDAEGKSVKAIYRTLVLKLGKAHKVEALMDAIMKDVQVLAADRVFQTATQAQVEKLQQAIEELAKMKPSVPDHYFDAATRGFSHSGEGDLNVQYGDGDMNNVKGDMYKAQTMTFGMKSRSKKSESSDDSD